MSFILNSPAFSGIPTAPTAAAGTQTTQLATTAFVINQAGVAAPSNFTSGAANAGTSLYYARQDHTHLFIASSPLVWNSGSGTLSIQAANGSQGGYLTSSDWNTFSNKQNALGYQPLNKAGDTMTAGYLELANDPTLPMHAATKQYVDTKVQGLSPKASVHAATTAFITLSGTQTIDGISCFQGDRVLVKDQSAPKDNGIYVVQTGAWTRATDADAWLELVSAYVWVEQGNVNGDTGWYCGIDPGGALGTTAVTFTQFSGASEVTAGTGLTKTGNVISLSPVTINRVIVSDGSGIFSASVVTNTELGYLQGVTSSIQTQLNAKANLVSPTFTGTPQAPTATTGDNSNQIATTAFVQTAISSSSDIKAITTKTSAYTLVNTDCTILADATTAGFTLTLPPTPPTGIVFNIKKIDSTNNAVTVAGNGKMIDGAASFSINAQWNSYSVQYNGTNWLIV